MYSHHLGIIILFLGSGVGNMQTIIRLNDEDIKNVIAQHFQTDVSDVYVKAERITCGYGAGEHDEYRPCAEVQTKNVSPLTPKSNGPEEKSENYDKEIADTFDRIMVLDGVIADDDGEIVIVGKNANDYLLIGLLGKLIHKGIVSVRIGNEISERDLLYMRRLLNVNRGTE